MTKALAEAGAKALFARWDTLQRERLQEVETMFDLYESKFAMLVSHTRFGVCYLVNKLNLDGKWKIKPFLNFM